MSEMNENNNIICQNCGSQNMAGTAFCTQCGNTLQMGAMNDSVGMQNQNNFMPQQNFNNGMNNMPQQQIQSQPQQNVGNTSANAGSLNFLHYILGTFTKPFENFKKEEDKLNDIKNVSILSAILVGASLILSLISTIISYVRVKNYFTGKTEWVWDNVKEFPYFKFLGQRLVLFAGALLLISVVYFIASRMVKKDTSFVKLLAASTSAFFPLTAAINVLSPILSKIFVELGICVVVIGFFYTLIILLELVNYLINIEKKDIKIYVNAACTSVITIIGGWVLYKMLLSEIASSLGGLF